MAARAISTAPISFGLVAIPVKLFTAASSEQVRFNTLHEKCGGRLKQQMYCPACDAIVGRGETVRGYEFARGQYVQFTDEEYKKLESEKDSSISIVEFVPPELFDMVQIERSYYLGPDKGGDKAYRLLSDSMTKAKKVAVGRWAARGKEQLVVIRPYRDGLLFHQMFYADEVRAFEDVDTGATFAFADVEKDLALRLIEQLSTDRFEQEKYTDSFTARVTEAVNQKAQGQELRLAPEAPRAQIIDLFEALKQSLSAEADGEKPKPPIKAAETAPAPLKRAKKRSS